MNGIISTIQRTAFAEAFPEPTATELTNTDVVFKDLNDFCLLEISEYLNVKDVRNLAATCNRLRLLLNSFLIAKKLEVIVVQSQDTVLHWDSVVVTVDALCAQVQQFGDFVEIFSINFLYTETSIWPRIAELLKQCPNLKTLLIENAHSNNLIMAGQCNSLAELLSNVSPQLKEFHWINHEELISVDLTHLRQLQKVTIDGKAGTFLLFVHCTKLTHLDIHCWHAGNSLPTEDLNILKEILQNNAQTLRTLKLRYFNYFQAPTLFRFIAENLQQLENLEIFDRILKLKSNFEYIEFKKVNILNLEVEEAENINELMMALSDFGVIEELTIHGHFYNVVRTRLLTFAKLRKLDLYQRDRNAEFPREFLRIITRASMPELHELKIGINQRGINADYFNEYIELIESKKTLTSLWIYCNCYFNVGLLAVKIAEMFKADLSGDRNFLRIFFFYSDIGEEQMQILTANKHLLSVNNAKLEMFRRERNRPSSIYYLLPHYDPKETEFCKSHPSQEGWWLNETFAADDYVISIKARE